MQRLGADHHRVGEQPRQPDAADVEVPGVVVEQDLRRLVVRLGVDAADVEVERVLLSRKKLDLDLSLLGQRCVP